MELRYSIYTSRWTQNVHPNGLFNVSTVNNGVAMYPKFVKSNRGVPSVATSPTNCHKEYACQEKQEHAKDCIPLKETYSVNCARITQHLIKMANGTITCGKS